MTGETQNESQQAVAEGRCPECGESLDGRDPVAEANKHWRGTGSAAPVQGTKAYERQQALIGAKR